MLELYVKVIPQSVHINVPLHIQVTKVILQCVMIYLILLMELLILLEQQLVTQLHTSAMMDMTSLVMML